MTTKTPITIVSSDNNVTSHITDQKEEIKNVAVSSDVTKDQDENNKTRIDSVDLVASEDTRTIKKEPTIDIDISMDKLNLGPKKKLLVIPLGGIIVHRAHISRPSTILKNRRPDLSYGNFLIYKRPFVKEFLKFCFERFEVGIWSSAREHNLEGVLNNVMGELKSKLLFTWDQNQCTDTGFKCLDNRDKPLFLKELSNLWEKKYPNLPWRNGEYSSSNTLLITDRVKTLVNPPNTAIFPGVYDPGNMEDNFLGPGGELRVFLEGLAEAKDVPTYVKDHPIGEPAITASDPDWHYYAQVIRAFGKKKTFGNKK
ncbi:uncharacterized protein [Rutidosis leptorrhynchoides]|uniref:uncharacterized protein n=1 Tax=Rutidosis leptorrhynchoides TaxID=125765 RepID=UPI003A996417